MGFPVLQLTGPRTILIYVERNDLGCLAVRKVEPDLLMAKISKIGFESVLRIFHIDYLHR